MKRFKAFTTGLLALLFVFSVGTAQAQLEQETTLPDEGYWDLNINSGVIIAQDELFTAGMQPNGQNIFEEDVQPAYAFGADLSYRFDSGFVLGGQFGWSPLTRQFNEENLFGQVFDQNVALQREFNLFTYAGTIGYTAAMGRFGLNVSAGLGAATQQFTDNTEDFIRENPDLFDDGLGIFEGDDTITSWQSPVSLTAKYALSRSVTINALARDYIIYEGENVDERLNNFYFGAGLSFLF